jgi:hypothetical protein
MSNARQATLSLVLLVYLCIQGCQYPSDIEPYPKPVSYPNDRLPLPALTLAPTKSALIGRVVLSNNHQALANTSIRLAKVQWNEQKTEGIFVLDTANSPGALTRSDGSFALMNIEPGDYVIIVGDVIGVHVIISEPDGKAKVYTAEQNQILDIGTVEIDWK